ncbi:hypothetical protein HYFRA_00012569 [Hymenoscyphus fraxineus]|uniref:Uncharacterized protein n=1 Tax=Hymenoscyphus fraxineus TaxID=746836 RepID=A0A9N9PTJ9_9HELO|nr:hypothetical protein HYFRA_00012569 [Hymenoscyphus fraxineus]
MFRLWPTCDVDSDKRLIAEATEFIKECLDTHRRDERKAGFYDNNQAFVQHLASTKTLTEIEELKKKQEKGLEELQVMRRTSHAKNEMYTTKVKDAQEVLKEAQEELARAQARVVKAQQDKVEINEALARHLHVVTISGEVLERRIRRLEEASALKKKQTSQEAFENSQEKEESKGEDKERRFIMEFASPEDH